MLKQVSAQMKTLEFRCRATNGYRKVGVQTYEAGSQTDLAGVDNDIIKEGAPREAGLAAADTDPPPPYTSQPDLSQRHPDLSQRQPDLSQRQQDMSQRQQDLSQRQSDLSQRPQVPPLSVESGYLSRGSSLSPDSARQVWERYGQPEVTQPVARVMDAGRRPYSPSRSVAIDEVQIRYGPQSPPERDTPLQTSTPAKQTPPDQRPRSNNRAPPPREPRRFSPSGTGRYQAFPHSNRGLSPNRNEGEQERPNENINQERRPPWVPQDRGTSPQRGTEAATTAPPSIPRPERCMSPLSREERGGD